MFLILLGDGVVAGVLLAKSKAKQRGLDRHHRGMGLRGLRRRRGGRPVQRRAPEPGRHDRPRRQGRDAVGPGARATSSVSSSARCIGALLVVLHYWPHWEETEDPGLKLAVFSTGPAIRNYGLNFVSEVIGTFVLVFVVLAFGTNGDARPASASLGALPVALLVLVDRHVARRHDRVRDQPGPRPRAAHHPRRSCRSPARAPRTGRTPGSRSSARSSAASSRRSCLQHVRQRSSS